MTWTVDPRKFGVECVKKHRQLCRRLALGIENRIVLATPVDTGRARSNWIASLDKPATGVIDAYAPDADEKPGQIGPNAAGAIAAADAVLLQTQDFPVIYLSNNLPYIARLNDGSSVQAPAAFVQAAIDQELGPFR